MAESKNPLALGQRERESSNNGLMPGPRPYRSHRFPACDFCRRRKSRCTRDLIDETCLLCRKLGLVCSSSSSSSSIDPPERRSGSLAHSGKKRKRQSLEKQGSEVVVEPVYVPELLMPSPPCDLEPSPVAIGLFPVSGTRSAATSAEQSKQKHSGHIVGPALARDAQVLEQYMLPIYNTAVSHARPNPYSVYSDDPRNPVVYLKVPRQRGILPIGNGTSSFRQLETMEKLLEPLGPDLFQTYFDRLHPAFPILDEKTVLEAYRHDGLPHALVCEIYAVSLISWRTSSRITKARPQPPDIKYMWNLAVSALNEDFLSPSFSTVLTCLLDILGRPITSITYNAINIGRCVALSQSLGLNRNPSSWKLDQRQKSLRIRTWWGLLIHDTWLDQISFRRTTSTGQLMLSRASLSHGTPKHIRRCEWDVPVPDLECLQIGVETDRGAETDNWLKGAHSFVALCQLTEILGDMLPLIYTLHPKENNYLRSLRRLQLALDEWEASLPCWLNSGSSEFEREASGALNLQLSFLAVKMCMCRIALHEVARSEEPHEKEVQQYHQLKCRKAATAVVDFVVSLRSGDAIVFWLPYAAYHFTSAASLLLRCALESEKDATAQECINGASSLLDRLHQLKNEVNWDLSDMCIEQCGDIVARMSDGGYLEYRRGIPHVAGEKHSTSQVPSTNVQLTGTPATNAAQRTGEQQQNNREVETTWEEDITNVHRNDLNTPNVGSATSSRTFGFHNPTILDQGYPMEQEYPPSLDFWQIPQLDGHNPFW